MDKVGGVTYKSRIPGMVLGQAQYNQKKLIPIIERFLIPG